MDSEGCCAVGRGGGKRKESLEFVGLVGKVTYQAKYQASMIDRPWASLSDSSSSSAVLSHFATSTSVGLGRGR